MDKPRIEYSAYEAAAIDHDNDWRRIQDAERALESAIKERDELEQAFNELNNRMRFASQI